MLLHGLVRLLLRRHVEEAFRDPQREPCPEPHHEAGVELECLDHVLVSDHKPDEQGAHQPEGLQFRLVRLLVKSLAFSSLSGALAPLRFNQASDHVDFPHPSSLGGKNVLMSSSRPTRPAKKFLRLL